MRELKLWFGCLMIVFISSVSFSALAQDHYQSYKFHFKDLLAVEREIAPIAVGCELPDCCPECSGLPRTIDWQISLEGDALGTIILRFENLSPELAKRLRLKGNVKWIDRTRLRVGSGESFVGGFSDEPKSRPPVAFPHVSLDDAVIQRARGESRKHNHAGSDDGGNLRFSIRQHLGRTTVYEYKFAFNIDLTPLVFLARSDHIVLDNNIGLDTAVAWVDAHAFDLFRPAGACGDDLMYRGQQRMLVGDLRTANGCNSEVVVFSDDNAMELRENVNTWTGALGDILTIHLSPILQVPIKVWLVNPGDEPRARMDIARAIEIYNRSNCGITFVPDFEVVPANKLTLLTDPLAVCRQSEPLNALKARLFAANRINVYYINSAEQFNGLTCMLDSNIIFITTTASDTSLAHEIGHSFSLDHSDMQGLNPSSTNLMRGMPGSELTEGQCFRCNANFNSSLNANRIRVGPTRDCRTPNIPPLGSNPRCPFLLLDSSPN